MIWPAGGRVLGGRGTVTATGAVKSRATDLQGDHPDSMANAKVLRRLRTPGKPFQGRLNRLTAERRLTTGLSRQHRERVMGPWGIGSFDNADAADFLAEVTDGGDLSPVREVFDNVLTSTQYVEAPDARQAIAAAEIVAAALGRATPAGQAQDRLGRWLTRVRPDVEPELVAQAAAVLSRILAPNSALLEWWYESDEFAEWRANVDELRGQLYGQSLP